jgi:alpha-1,2-rhamnosyltransferase
LVCELEQIPLVLVSNHRDKFVEVSELRAPIEKSAALTFLSTARRWTLGLTEKLRRGNNPSPLKSLLSKLLYPPNALLRFCWKLLLYKRFTSQLSVSGEDILILLDSSWDRDACSALKKNHSGFSCTIALIYDLVPISHPYLTTPWLRQNFNRWLSTVAAVADGFVCISRSSERNLIKYLEKNKSQQDSVVPKWSDVVYLSGELPAQSPPRNQQILGVTTSPYCLAVGTIEPRKNYMKLIEAFELLWDRGCELRLVIVGNIGWEDPSLIDRIFSHREMGGRLILLSQVEDDALNYIYLRSQLVISTSLEEGFGLTLAEAIHFGCKFACSDIEVFKEICGPTGFFFNPLSCGEIAEVIEKALMCSASSPVPRPLSYKWNESARRLFRVVTSRARNHAARQ